MPNELSHYFNNSPILPIGNLYNVDKRTMQYKRRASCMSFSPAQSSNYREKRARITRII